LLDGKDRKEAFQKELKERFAPEEGIKQSFAEEIFQPATAFKLAIADRRISR
jgi:formiminotetrahydrofolate cyclodeaminase